MNFGNRRLPWMVALEVVDSKSESAMQRKIVGFHQDAQGVWVAELECSHGQHVRHNPPFQQRPWVMAEEGRRDKLGVELDCLYCNMATLPADVKAYRQTARFTNETMPAGLLADHRTKVGVWGRIVVEQGQLQYSCAQGVFVLQPGVVGIVEPNVVHHVMPLGEVAFYVEFLKRPDGA